jgi:hypothetical protein
MNWLGGFLSWEQLAEDVPPLLLCQTFKLGNVRHFLPWLGSQRNREPVVQD